MVKNKTGLKIEMDSADKGYTAMLGTKYEQNFKSYRVALAYCRIIIKNKDLESK